MKSATDSMVTEFHPTRVELPSQPLTERGRRDLIRTLESEQGFAHRALPMGGQGITLQANGTMGPDASTLRKNLYEKGISAQAGDRVMVTKLTFERDRILIDLDGGPYLKHRWLSHVQINDSNVVAPQEAPTGARIALVFEQFVPDITGPEVKSLLEPIVDFGVKTSEEAYANTLPEPLKLAVADHRILVGMNHRMVLAAAGQPAMKVREKIDEESGNKYEEWIYGRTPETLRFVRFVGDKVVLLKIAALGKPLEIHDKDEMDAYLDPDKQKTIAMGDVPGTEEAGTRKPPSLRRDGEPQMGPASPSLVRLPAADDSKKQDASPAKPPEQQLTASSE